MQRILRSTPKGRELYDERGRTMRFPRRQDYVQHLQKHGEVEDEDAFVMNDRLTEAVYLDWLLRPQVGCVFAQLLARPINRTGARTVVARGSSRLGDPRELAIEISQLVNECANDQTTEALSVLLPQIVNVEALTKLVWELGKQPGWIIEMEHLWRRTLIIIGLRVDIAPGVLAETLGMGPFEIFPPTRQCPVTTLEIRTKAWRAPKSKLSRGQRAAHLAQIDVSHILTPKQYGLRFDKYTPWLRRRILGKRGDMRAKAGTTYSVPAPIWNSLKNSGL